MLPALDYFRNRIKAENRHKESYFNSAGDADTKHCRNHTDTLMSWNFKGKKPKKKADMSPESYASKFAVEYLNNFQREDIDPNASSCADNSRNTDTVIHIGDEEFHCHYIVLQVYSSFFDMNPHREIELPIVPRVMRFFLPLVASRDFIDLDTEELMIFLKSNYISVTSTIDTRNLFPYALGSTKFEIREIEVLMAGVRWLYGDWSARRRFSVEVMRCVRFGLISPWQLVDIKRNPDNAEILEIVNEPEVQQMVDDGLA
ncbi:hypothetical protein B5X24_HaOG212187 [Helicoverpa armigera]|nr:hypothetical protein B5X24_HaOG212187 [Helicoverpa armigera]